MAVEEEGKRIKDSESLAKTQALEKFPSLTNLLYHQGVTTLARAAFFKLAPGHGVGSHIDDGQYYQKKDRFHLSISGKYEYECNGEIHIIEPGTLFWFDNKKIHRAANRDVVDRITFVFDVPIRYSPVRDCNLDLISF